MFKATNFILSLGAALSLSMIASAADKIKRPPLAKSLGVSTKSPFAPTDNPIYDQFMQNLTRQNSDTMDGFLATLKAQPDFFQAIKAKTVFYNSQSRHQSSFMFPRAIIMYENANLLVTFNGSPNQKLYGALEIAGYNRRTSEFEFREVTFKKDTAPGDLSEIENESTSEFDFDNSFIKIRKANPEKCTACHGVDPQPIWGTYLAWRGSFGSFEESIALDKPRYAKTPGNIEYKMLQEFQANAPRLARYRNFYWGQPEKEFNFEISSTLVGIGLNYRMGHNALREALKVLSQPEKQKYKYAFAGYLLNCPDSFLPGDSESDLSDVKKSLMRERVNFEKKERQGIEKDILQAGDRLSWKYTIAQGSESNSLTARPEAIFQWARIENLYRAMKTYPGRLYLPGSKGSWDGYNEIQDYMSDYLLRYYRLPSVTAENKVRAEKGSTRSDLDMPLTDADYESIRPAIENLGLPQISGAMKARLCRDLADASHINIK